MRAESNHNVLSFKRIYRNPVTGTKQSENLMKGIAKILKTPTDEFTTGKKISPVHWAEKKGLHIFLEPAGTKSAKVELVSKDLFKSDKFHKFSDVGYYSNTKDFKAKQIKDSYDKKSVNNKTIFDNLVYAVAMVALGIASCIAIQKARPLPKKNPVQKIEKVSKTVSDTIQKVTNDTIKLFE